MTEMSQTLREIAQKLQASEKKVQLLYAFNGNGKTRLSREFKELISPKYTAGTEGDEEEENNDDSLHPKILYYNAFTEDLFYWDNDLHGDVAPKSVYSGKHLHQMGSVDQGQDRHVIPIRFAAE